MNNSPVPPSDSSEKKTYQPLFFYFLLNGFLIKIVFIFLVFLLTGVYVDSLLGSHPIVTALGTLGGLLYIGYDGFHTLREIIAELDQLAVQDAQYNKQDKKAKVKRILKYYLAKKTSLKSQPSSLISKEQKKKYQDDLFKDFLSPNDTANAPPAKHLPHHIEAGPLIEQLRETELLQKQTSKLPNEKKT